MIGVLEHLPSSIPFRFGNAQQARTKSEPFWGTADTGRGNEGKTAKYRISDLIGQREGVHCAVARPNDVLLSVYSVADWTACIGTPKVYVP